MNPLNEIESPAPRKSKRASKTLSKKETADNSKKEIDNLNEPSNIGLSRRDDITGFESSKRELKGDIIIEDINKDRQNMIETEELEARMNFIYM
jgi:hypothetical protein